MASQDGSSPAKGGGGIPRRKGVRGMLEAVNMLQVGANATAMLLFLSFLRQFVPQECRDMLAKWVEPLLNRFNRYCYYKIPETSSGHIANELFDAVQTHLGATTAPKANRASLLREKGSSKVSYIVSSGDGWIKDCFQGHSVYWKYKEYQPPPRNGEILDRVLAHRSFNLKIHKAKRDEVLNAYMDHVMKNARKVKAAKRERKLYTNASKYISSSKQWAGVAFHHPSTFETLAIDPDLKKRIVDDLTAFAESENFYNKVGRAWKRGYLLYGPPGTGKSSMIAAMANFMNYDIYDLELTAVADNAELRKLLLQTTSRSIIVIEDIDCTIPLDNRAQTADATTEKEESGKNKSTSEGGRKGVTLSGLLNFTDGIWSCCGSERIVIFTTNHMDKLDPALLRTGRMDMKIHLSYCSFPAFKVLASNYLYIDHHELYGKLEKAFDGSRMTPADVSEHLMKNRRVENALLSLIEALERKKLEPLVPNEDAHISETDDEKQ